MILALTVITVGLVWIGQGMGLLRGTSFMVDDGRWAIAGAACVTIGLVIAIRGLPKRPG